jgi:hypothetical protein
MIYRARPCEVDSLNAWKNRQELGGMDLHSSRNSNSWTSNKWYVPKIGYLMRESSIQQRSPNSYDWSHEDQHQSVGEQDINH